ncbi:MAG: hypothetical protein BWZ05_00871 [Bacteroidetes bacterium ADurb.BinA245]|nr:MAG: hypothetical protein BWZ05_00871 [Bacteroidetes bacterium ADurb.BinA245]
MPTQKANIINALRMLNTQKLLTKDDLSIVIPALVFMAEKFNWNAFGLMKKYGNNWKEISIGLGQLLFQGDVGAEKDLSELNSEYYTIHGLSSGMSLFLDKLTLNMEQKDIKRKALNII